MDWVRGHFGGSSRKFKWVRDRNGHVPSGAFVGGRDHDGVLYVARARHLGGWVPGKLNPLHGQCYIPVDGKEIAYSEYEVLCGSNMFWVRQSGNKYPILAVLATEPPHKPVGYFVGRVRHNGTLTLGKVNAKDGTCYIPYNGKEYVYREYEILVEQER